MDARPTPDEVSRIPLFFGLDEEEHRRLAALGTVETLEPGAVVFALGDPPGPLYVVLEGRVTLSMEVRGCHETSFLSLRPYELLGWSGLLHRRRVATARAVQRSRLLALNVSALLELCEQDHHVGYAIMRQAFEEMADRLHHTRLQLLDIFGGPRG